MANPAHTLRMTAPGLRPWGGLAMGLTVLLLGACGAASARPEER